MVHTPSSGYRLDTHNNWSDYSDTRIYSEDRGFLRLQKSDFQNMEKTIDCIQTLITKEWSSEHE